MAKSAPVAAPNLDQINANQRAAVLARGLDQSLQIYSATRTDAVGSVLNIPLRNVGLVKKFTVLIAARVKQAAAETLNITKFGPANFFSNILLTDLQNQTRVNTTGWHLHYVQTMRNLSAFGAAFTNDSPTGIGNNWSVISAPSAVTTQQTVYMAYEIPVSYSDQDLRGAIYANVLNATWNLALTVNPNLIVGSGGNPVQAMYQSSTANDKGSLVSFDIEVYQHFIDQLPLDQNGNVIVPMLDTSVMYRLENTVQTGLVANQEQAVPYANFRQFLSTFALYDNAGVLNAGSDMSYFGLQTANTTNLFKKTPRAIALDVRRRIGDDLPGGMYYFDHRGRPITTSAFGNVQLTFMPTVVTSNASQLLMAYEYFAQMNVLTQAGSIQN
jgi:hypothetical protein